MKRGLQIALLSCSLAACVAPGGLDFSVGETPDTTWTGAKLRASEGEPMWATVVDGVGTAAYYKLASGWSANQYALFVIRPDDRFVCADGTPDTYKDVACENEVRERILDTLRGYNREQYENIIGKNDTEFFAKGALEIPIESRLSEAEIAAAYQRGAQQPIASDAQYASALHCTLTAAWRADHASIRGLSGDAAQALSDQFATKLYAMAESRGTPLQAVNRDLELTASTLQISINLSARRFRARLRDYETCEKDVELSEPPTVWLSELSNQLHRYVIEQLRLAQALAVSQYPEPPADQGRDWELIDVTPPTFPIGQYETQREPSDVFTDYVIGSEPWKAALAEARKRRIQSVSSDFFDRITATPGAREETLGAGSPDTAMIRLSSLVMTLDAQIGALQLEATVETFSEIALFYILEQQANVTAAKLLSDVGALAFRLGKPKQAASLKLLSGDLYLNNADRRLAAAGFASEGSRDVMREALAFEPYFYERDNFDGTAKRVYVTGPKIDAKAMLDLIQLLGSDYYYVAQQYAFAVPYFARPEEGAELLSRMAENANARFSSSGAAGLYRLSATAYRVAEKPQLALLAQLRAGGSLARARSNSSRETRDSACESDYLPFRVEFDKQFNDPSSGDIERIFGEPFAKMIKRTDQWCRY